MRTLLNGRWLMGAAAATTLLGCGADRVYEPGKGELGIGHTPVDPYPAAPYGYAVNNVIEDFKLFGRRDENKDGSVLNDTAKDLWLSDYRRDPGAEEMNKVIVVTASAEWCVPCNDEQPELVNMHNEYEARGVRFLEAVVQNRQGGPSDDATIKRWATKHGIPFDLALDPGMALQKYYDINAFPFGMVIRVSDMNIVWQGNGVATDAIKKSIDFVLAEE